MSDFLRYRVYWLLAAIWTGMKVFAFLLTVAMLVLSIWVAYDWWEFAPVVAYTAVVIAVLCAIVIILSAVVWFMEHDLFPEMNTDDASPARG